MPQTEIPKSALNFSHEMEVEFAEQDEERKAKMLGYSGQPMDHWLFGSIIVDVEGIKFNQKKIPILEDHEEEKKIGFSKKPSTENYKVYFDDITLLNNSFANEFYENAKSGFPYQASISFYPKKIEEVLKGSSTDVNGFTIKGPALIFRESVFRESSVVTFGRDHRTSTEAYSDENVSINMGKESSKILEKLMTQNKNNEGHTTETPAENSQNQEETDNMSEKLQEMEQQVQSYKDELSTYKDQLAKVQRQATEKDLSTKLGQEESEFIMKFYDKLSVEEMHELADKIVSYNKKIDEAGQAQGTGETPREQSEPTFDEIQAYAKENGITFTEANEILYKQRNQ